VLEQGRGLKANGKRGSSGFLPTSLGHTFCFQENVHLYDKAIILSTTQELLVVGS